MGYIGDGPKPELEVGDISTKDVTATGDVTISDKIIHSGDTNTAIRFSAADTVTVETAGSERMCPFRRRHHIQRRHCDG